MAKIAKDYIAIRGVSSCIRTCVLKWGLPDDNTDYLTELQVTYLEASGLPSSPRLSIHLASRHVPRATAANVRRPRYPFTYLLLFLLFPIRMSFYSLPQHFNVSLFQIYLL
jgi:hypothetical protein